MALTSRSISGQRWVYGLSSDNKPGADPGDKFVETDTGDVYTYSGSAWFQAGSESGGGVGGVGGVGELTASGNLKVSLEEQDASTIINVETNVSRFYQDSMRTHGRALLSFDLTVTANDATLIAAPATGLKIRLYRATFKARVGATLPIEAGIKFGTGGSQIETTPLTTEGQPGGFNIGHNYLEGPATTALVAYLSGASSVRYAGYYEVIDPADEPVEI